MLYIGVLQFTLELPYAESLKEKRGVLKSLKDRLRRSFNVSFCEFEDLDDPTIATMGAVVAGSDTKHCLLYTSPSPRDQRGSRMPSSA